MSGPTNGKLPAYNPVAHLASPPRPAPTMRDLSLDVLAEALRLCLDAGCVPPAIFEEVERVLFAESRSAAERRALAVATGVDPSAPDIPARVACLAGASSRLMRVIAPPTINGHAGGRASLPPLGRETGGGDRPG